MHELENIGENATIIISRSKFKKIEIPQIR